MDYLSVELLKNKCFCSIWWLRVWTRLCVSSYYLWNYYSPSLYNICLWSKMFSKKSRALLRCCCIQLQYNTQCLYEYVWPPFPDYVHLSLCASRPSGRRAQVPLHSPKLKSSSADNSRSCYNASYVPLSTYLPDLLRPAALVYALGKTA